MAGKLKAYIRILKIAKKPGLHEFKTILKVTGLGVIIIGVIGFAIRMASNFIR